jgi:hypothetical protein
MSAAASPKNLKSKVGAEPRKVAILAGLLLVAAAVFIYNLSSGPSYSNVPAGLTSRTVPTAAPVATAPRQNAARRKLNQRPIERSTIRMRGVTAEAQRGDVDPTLRLDLLQRLQNVQPSASSRNLFDVGAATPQATEAAAPKIIPGPLPQTANSDPQTAAPATPTTEPIPLKFYGFSSPVSVTGPRRGFFLDGDNILIASEGEMLKGRYRVVNLSARSADVEDVQTKNRQSLPLMPEVQNANF